MAERREVGVFSLFNALQDLVSFAKSPLPYIVGGVGIKTVTSASLDLLDLLFFVLGLCVAVAAISLILWLLPKTYHVIFIFALTCIVSMLSTGWCLTEQEKCIALFASCRSGLEATHRLFMKVMANIQKPPT